MDFSTSVSSGEGSSSSESKLEVHDVNFLVRKQRLLDICVEAKKAIDMTCSMCLDVLRDPFSSLCCGQDFCNRCRLKPGSPCPSCDDDKLELEKDQRMAESVAKLLVRCLWSDECKWEGDIGNDCEGLKAHLKNECLRTVVSCPNTGCNEVLHRADMIEHKPKCEFPKGPCANAEFGCTAQVGPQDRKQHEASCKFTPSVCESCGARFAGNLKAAHELGCVSKFRALISDSKFSFSKDESFKLVCGDKPLTLVCNGTEVLATRAVLRREKNTLLERIADECEERKADSIHVMCDAETMRIFLDWCAYRTVEFKNSDQVVRVLKRAACFNLLSLVSFVQQKGISGMTMTGGDFTEFAFTEPVWHDVNFSQFDFKRCHFSDGSISKGSFVQCVFMKSGFVATKLHDVTFSRCDLRGIFFAGVTFSGCTFKECQVDKLSFNGCTLTDSTKFIDMDISKLDLRSAKIAGADFSGLDLRSMDFKARDVRGCLFKKADLRGCNFSGALAESAIFLGAELEGVQFNGATVKGASFSGLSLAKAGIAGDMEGCVFRGCDASGLELKGASLRGTHFENTNLTGAVFRDVDMTNATFAGSVLRTARFVDCNLAGIVMKDAKMDGLVMEGYDFTGGDFSNASLENAVLSDCIFDRCNLEGCNLRRATLERCSFRDAIMTAVNLTSANCQHAVIQDSNLSNSTVVSCNFGFADIRQIKTEGTEMGRALYESEEREDWRDFRYGDIIDVRDTSNNWYESMVIDVGDDDVRIHYINWADTYDERIANDSERLAPRGTHTNGPYNP